VLGIIVLSSLSSIEWYPKTGWLKKNKNSFSLAAGFQNALCGSSTTKSHFLFLVVRRRFLYHWIALHEKIRRTLRGIDADALVDRAAGRKVCRFLQNFTKNAKFGETQKKEISKKFMRDSRVSIANMCGKRQKFFR
jgi:hypothetical protein